MANNIIEVVWVGLMVKVVKKQQLINIEKNNFFSENNIIGLVKLKQLQIENQVSKNFHWL